LLEKVNCARRFEEKPYLKKLHGTAEVPSGPRRARTKRWLRAQDAAHRVCQKLCGRRCLKRSTAFFSVRGHISHFSLGVYIPLSLLLEVPAGSPNTTEAARFRKKRSAKRPEKSFTRKPGLRPILLVLAAREHGTSASTPHVCRSLVVVHELAERDTQDAPRSPKNKSVTDGETNRQTAILIKCEMDSA
jgi:hypothetical protein